VAAYSAGPGWSQAKDAIEQLERKIVETVVRFEREYMGHSARRVSAYVVRDLVVIRSAQILSPAERQLVMSEEGRVLLKQLRVKELEGLRNVLKFTLESVIGVPVIGLNIDVSMEENERVVLCRLSRPVDVAPEEKD